MLKLEDIIPNVVINGILPNTAVRIISATMQGQTALSVVYRSEDGRFGEQLLYRKDEPSLSLATARTAWDLRLDARRFRRAAEARRIELAHTFDPQLAVNISNIEPLPHQLSAVYEAMLPRLPLRFLLADDPGAGKTIMAGLLIRELIMRNDVRRCLICAPGSLVEQWQAEMYDKFTLSFKIMTRDVLENAYHKNPFDESDLFIIRLDQFSRTERWQTLLLTASPWDIVIVDEAHKMSAPFNGGEIKRTKRYSFGEKLSAHTRHFLLMTATPHNGKEADFQTFLRLLDSDRFHMHRTFKRQTLPSIDLSDLMRRMVKENLKTFAGEPLFPERLASTVAYELSDLEMQLYKKLTGYVQHEFNRADSMDSKKKNTVGFALTALQRRFASSPYAIWRSLQNRRKRLERRWQEQDLKQKRSFDLDEWDDFDEAPDPEREHIEHEIADSATTASTIAELRREIDTLLNLEWLAKQVIESNMDRKWEELADLLQNTAEMFDEQHHRRHKLIVFTEYRDTLNHLKERVSKLLGDPSAVVTIYGAMPREERLKAQVEFTNNPNVLVLIATDAAGEGINLHTAAHLMVNYDLPWNPNRLEQRFGRIHRIGQREVCYLWNLVANQTREGAVYERLLQKIETIRKQLGGKVYDVLGRLFIEQPLRDLLVEAIRYGEDASTRAKLFKRVDNAADQERIRRLLKEHALIDFQLDDSHLTQLREDMLRAEARRLQPYYIRGFFKDAFEALGGKYLDLKNGIYRDVRVPDVICTSALRHEPIASRYGRICFDKKQTQERDQPTLITPGHPLLDAIVRLTKAYEDETLLQGAVLLDPNDHDMQPRLLYLLESHLQDGTGRIVSSELRCFEVSMDRELMGGGYAPYLDYLPLEDAQKSTLDPWLASQAPDTAEFERIVQEHAVQILVPEHFARVSSQRSTQIERIQQAVQTRLTQIIQLTDQQALAFERKGDRLNVDRERKVSNELKERLHRRERELEALRTISAQPPRLIGRALIVPQGLLDSLQDSQLPTPALAQNRATEQIAMNTVLAVERWRKCATRDVSADKCGYDIESRAPDGTLWLIEVKGRQADAETVALTHNEILTALNRSENYILALVEVENGRPRTVYYLKKPPVQDPGEYAACVMLRWQHLIGMAELVWRA
ncbi:MAG: DUF3883 domain-containing protein [Chloroflexi bacterium CFX4]|nr:DUF3883 domain-containing protein [Chloroflexi bacterium CFX4]MDL1920995.1 DUF3883 domain-containing protein [Chloroflexi bacterium CFX3]